MTKYLFLAFLALFLTACGSVTFNYNTSNQDLSFDLKEGEPYAIKLTNPVVTLTHDSCTFYSYVLNDDSSSYGKIFIEDISLQSNCKWNGLDLSFFESNFKDTLKLQSMKKIENIAINNYEFLTYKINDDSYMNLIYIFGVSTTTFIVDYEGKLSNELLEAFDKNVTSNYVHEKRFSSNFNDSLVRKNLFKGYFNQYSEDYSSK